MKEPGGKRLDSTCNDLGLRRHVGRWILLLLATLFAMPQALALGLGQAQVQSYLQQPLDARIDLISRSEAEMATVTAGLASPSDFQVLGLTRAAISTPLEFEVYRDLSDPHIRVTSRLPMDEPVVQLVVEVVWASGRMLRQYTLFLDPPTFDAPAPLPAPSAQRSTAPVSEPVAPQEEPVPEILMAPSVSPPAQTIDDVAEAQPAVTESGAAAAIASADPESRPQESLATPGAPAGPPFDPAPELPTAAEPEALTIAEPEEIPEGSEFLSSVTDEPIDSESATDAGLEPLADASVDPLAETSVETTPADLTPVVSEDVVAGEPAEEPSSLNLADTSVPEAEPAVTLDSMPATATEEPPPEMAVESPAPEPVESFPQEPEPVAQVPTQPYRAVLPEPGQSLPNAVEVQTGDTLWSLSGTYAAAQNTSVNQVMLAVQQKNPNAFIDGNINALKAGEILRMPTREEVVAQDAREAMLEVLRQESLYRTRWDLPPSPEALPTISNLAEAGSSSGLPAPVEPDQPAVPAPMEPVEDDSRLELVPPTEAESQEVQGMGQGGSGETAVSSGESVVEELARAREELANAEQEKAYLEERLSELEAELARRDAAAEESGVADTTLAEMEDRLREERLAGEEVPELELPPTGSRWLSGYGPALAGLLVLALVALVWFLRSRRDPEFTAGLEKTESEDASGIELQEEPTTTQDLESDDPETMLDLARAYMAMGKNSQARDCIEAVTRNGTPTQVREARTMLAEL